MTPVRPPQNGLDDAHSGDRPVLSRKALAALYRGLRELLQDDGVLRRMRRLSDPFGKAFMAPELSGQLRDELIEDVLTVALPIVWRDWRPTATEPAAEVSE
jgi:hypothetical protein